MSVIMDAMISSSGLSTSSQLTSMERSKSEVSSVSEGLPNNRAVLEEGEEEEEEEEESVLEDRSKWGPLKVPVTVKIADLGNACWVVSGCGYCY